MESFIQIERSLLLLLSFIDHGQKQMIFDIIYFHLCKSLLLFFLLATECFFCIIVPVKFVFDSLAVNEPVILTPKLISPVFSLSNRLLSL